VNAPAPAARRYWWVNQNQTFRQEIGGGYLWSPKRKADGAYNRFYDFMREVAPGDLVFSFRDTLIQAIGVATDYCFEAPKPADFGNAGKQWDRIGWKVPVRWTMLSNRIRPASHMDTLAVLLPTKYAPLRVNGKGLQSVYLAEVPESMAFELGRLIGPPVSELVRDRALGDLPDVTAGRARAELIEWEDHLERQIMTARTMSDTERMAVVKARRGQGQFRDNVLQVERRCRITRVDRPEHLVASHCKPWRDCADASERLDGENGLMLTPTIDHLFDRGFISFENDGGLIVSPRADRASLARMGIDPSASTNVGAFSGGQKAYLETHRESVFLEVSR